MTAGDRREPPADIKCPPAAQRKQAKRACYIQMTKNAILVKEYRFRQALINKHNIMRSKFQIGSGNCLLVPLVATPMVRISYRQSNLYSFQGRRLEKKNFEITKQIILKNSF